MLTSKDIVAVVTAGVAAAGIFIGAISVAFALRNGPDAQTAGFAATIALLVGVGASARAVTLRRQHDHQAMTEARRPDTLARLDPRLDPRRWRTEHQVALMVAMALGGLGGLVFSASHIDFYKAWLLSVWDASILTGDVIRVLLWTLFGALIAGGGVYVIQMLRPRGGDQP
jgi:hypothetical protein